MPQPGNRETKAPEKEWPPKGVPYYYADEHSVIYHGDCLTIAPLLTGIDAVVSDPPYGIDYAHSTGGLGKHSRRNLMRITGDAEPFDPVPWLSYPDVLLWGADHFYPRLPDSGRWLAWNKLGALESWDSFSDVEFAWHSRDGAARVFNMLYKGIASAKGGESVIRQHPSQKPIRLMLWCLEQAKVQPGQTILDPYMGTGTTLVAAKLRGIKAVGIELEERYVKIAVERLRQGVLIPC